MTIAATGLASVGEAFMLGRLALIPDLSGALWLPDERTLVVADLPFGSYQSGPDQALATSVRMMKEGLAHAVKLEGGARVAPSVERVVGAGIPVTPWDWSFDLDEEQAAERLAGLPRQALLVVHSQPKGHCDQSSSGQSLGSTAIADAIAEREPLLAVCGHIHEAWGQRSQIGQR